MSDNQYIERAKEKVAKKYEYKAWGNLLVNDTVDLSIRLLEVMDLALQLQRQDLEKERENQIDLILSNVWDDRCAGGGWSSKEQFLKVMPHSSSLKK